MERPVRKHNRLPQFDYSQEGCYFVTLCTYNRAALFQMEQNTPSPSVANQLIHKWLRITEAKFPAVHIDKYIIMADHIHLIVTISQSCSGSGLPDIMRFFKTMTTNDYIRYVKDGALPPFDQKLWQKSYYDHVIRNQKDYDEIWEYIENNPTKWKMIHNQL